MFSHAFPCCGPAWFVGGVNGNPSCVVSSTEEFSEYGAAFTASDDGLSYQAVQVRWKVVWDNNNSGCGSGVHFFQELSPAMEDPAVSGHFVASTSDGSSSSQCWATFSTSGPYGLCAQRGEAHTISMMFDDQTQPRSPTTYWTGGSGTSAEPCSLTLITGPSRPFVAGTSYTWRLHWTNTADSITARMIDEDTGTDKAPPVTITAPTTPLDITLTPTESGPWVPNFICTA